MGTKGKVKIMEDEFVADLKGKTKNQLLALIMRLRKREVRDGALLDRLAKELMDTRKYGDRMAREKEQAAKNHEVELEVLGKAHDHREAKLSGEIAGLRDALRIVSGDNS